MKVKTNMSPQKHNLGKYVSVSSGIYRNSHIYTVSRIASQMQLLQCVWKCITILFEQGVAVCKQGTGRDMATVSDVLSVSSLCTDNIILCIIYRLYNLLVSLELAKAHWDYHTILCSTAEQHSNSGMEGVGVFQVFALIY